MAASNEFSLWRTQKTESEGEMPTTETPLGRVLILGKLQTVSSLAPLREVRYGVEVFDPVVEKLLEAWRSERWPISLAITRRDCSYYFEDVWIDFDHPQWTTETPRYFQIHVRLVSEVPNDESETWKDKRAKRLYAYNNHMSPPGEFDVV
jgi:hypothetical protein